MTDLLSSRQKKQYKLGLDYMNQTFYKKGHPFRPLSCRELL